MIVKTLEVGMLGTNCYLLCDETAKVCAVIDPGAEAREIASAVEKTGCAPCAIFLTHGHYDHTDAVPELMKLWPEVPVYLSCKDQYLDGDPFLLQLFPPLPLTRNYGEGDTFSVGELEVKVLATPGHSEGSVSLLCEDALFAGDTLFAGSCGRTDYPGGSMNVILESLKRLGNLPGNPKVYSGHMESSTLNRERRTNPYLTHAMRL